MKMKKNYSIDSRSVKLLKELSRRLHFKQGELLDYLITFYGLTCYEDIIKQRLEAQLQGDEELNELVDCARFEMYGYGMPESESPDLDELIDSWEGGQTVED